MTYLQIVLLIWQTITLYYISPSFSLLLPLGIILLLFSGFISYRFYSKETKAATALRAKTQELIRIKSQLQDKEEEVELYVESNIRLRQFAYVVSHDLKSSLNTIKSFTGLLKAKISDELGSQEKEYFDYIEKAATASETLVMDTLYYAQVKAAPLQLKKVNVLELVNSLLDSLKSVLETKNTTIYVEQLPQNVVADGKQLEKVFEAIIINAVKFMPNHKKSIIHIQSEENNKEWIFKISDNGIGISKENQEIVFDEFIKLNSKYEYPGTGFGLASSKNIIEKHGGKLWVLSSSEKGSTFAFTLNK